MRRGSGSGRAAPASEPGCAALRLGPDVYLLPPFSRPSSRAPATLHALAAICIGNAGVHCRPAPIRTGIRNRTPDTDGYAVRLDFRRTRLRLCTTPHSQTSGPGGSPRRWAGSSRKVRLETSLPRDSDDLSVTQTCNMTTTSKEQESESFPHAEPLECRR